MNGARRVQPCRKGIAAVELAIVLPLFLTFLVGIWEVGRLIELYNIVANSAREGARAAATAYYTNAQCVTISKTYLVGNNVPTGNVSVIVTPASPELAEQLDPVSCTVTLPFKDASWIILNMFVSNSSNVVSTVQWRSMADKPLAVDPALPIE